MDVPSVSPKHELEAGGVVAAKIITAMLIVVLVGSAPSAAQIIGLFTDPTYSSCVIDDAPGMVIVYAVILFSPGHPPR